jgi:hypothetical protein
VKNAGNHSFWIETAPGMWRLATIVIMSNPGRLFVHPKPMGPMVRHRTDMKEVEA